MAVDVSHQDVLEIEAGHFRETSDYRVQRPRGTLDWLLIYTRSGRGLFRYAGGEFVSERGDLLIYQPRTAHDYGMVTPTAPWELLWAHFQPRAEWHDYLRFGSVTRGTLQLRLGDADVRGRVENSLYAMVRLFTGPFRLAPRLAMNALEEALLWCDLANPRGREPQIDPRIRKATELLCLESSAPFSLGVLAKKCGLSESRLAHLFRAQIGSTPQKFHEAQRMARARQLLEHTDRPVKQIADELGFRSAYYFSVRFRRAAGTSPLAWRKRARQKGI